MEMPDEETDRNQERTMEIPVPEEADRDQELVEQAYMYLTAGTYPAGCSENRKRVIRKKSKKFELKDGELYYKQKQKGKVLNHHLGWGRDTGSLHAVSVYCRGGTRLVQCMCTKNIRL